MAGIPVLAMEGKDQRRTRQRQEIREQGCSFTVEEGGGLSGEVKNRNHRLLVESDSKLFGKWVKFLTLRIII